jgi:thioredoxin 1
VHDFGAQDFGGGRLRRPGRWVVDFTATWCPFCRDFLPVFRAVDGRLDAEMAFADVTDESSPLWEEFAIGAVPTVIEFEEGRPVRRLDGVLGVGLSTAQLARFLGRWERPAGT